MELLECYHYTIKQIQGDWKEKIGEGKIKCAEKCKGNRGEKK
jgi:hypothetical protein